MNPVEIIEITRWDEPIPDPVQQRAMEALETGRVLFFPELPFDVLPEELPLLSPQYAGMKTKNISLDVHSGKLQGIVSSTADCEQLKGLMTRFAARATALIAALAPRYKPVLETGRTSFRPVEIQGRQSSYRKDDTRLHIDAFPSTPVRDRRILRVFSNVNPDGKERLWRVGQDFEQVARTFLPKTRRQFWSEGIVLERLRITKSRRSPYDHTMLQLHDQMKADTQYQTTVRHNEVRFPARSTWIVFTDQVSHAALSGRHALEQTFYLPVEAMAEPRRSPLRVLERLTGRTMV
jgi:hypothetical protein